MNIENKTIEQLRAEIDELRIQLAESNDILCAIGRGEVDALIGEGPEGDQLFTLKGVDDPYRVLIEEMNQGAVSLSASGVILYCNRRFGELLKTPLEKVVSYSFDSFVAEDERPTFANLLEIGRSSSSAGEITLQAADGSAVPLQIALGPLPAESAAAMCLVATDISENRERETRLREMRENIEKAELANRQILDNSLDIICSFDAQSRFLQVSRACESIWGYSSEELIGRPFLDLVMPEDQAMTLSVEQTILEGRRANGFENRYVRKDGSVVPMVWTAYWSEELQINFCVARDITVRKQMEGELHRAKKIAEQANAAKSEFLANMSHEIRTPMNGIIGMTDITLETQLSDDQREYLGMVKTSAKSLLSLINDILDFSKIEAGKLEMESIGFSLRSCIGELIKPLAIQAGQKGLQITAEISADVPDDLTGDPLRLKQILINLISNAIKFTHHGHVKLRVTNKVTEDEGHRLHFTVSDTGIGIPIAKQALIFEAFSQADGSTTRTHGGTGLGLAIASELVRRMGGRIWVESEAGQGTVFHFTARFGEKLVLPHEEAINDSEASGPFQEIAASVKGLRILLAEDNPINRKVATILLQRYGHHVSYAVDGREAIEAVARESFDLIFMDVQMPMMDGFEATNHIRESELTTGHHVPIAAMTA